MTRHLWAGCLALVAHLALWAAVLRAEEPAELQNLLLNPSLGFQSQSDSRGGKAESWRAGAVACWNQDAHGDIDVCRAPKAAFRPRSTVDNIVTIRPGKRFYQFALLAELGLDNGDSVSLSAHGYQSAPGSLQAAIYLLRSDSQPGEWTPADDRRTFLKQARGDLIRGPSNTATSDASHDFRVVVEDAAIAGAVPGKPGIAATEANAIALVVEFTNLSKDQNVSIYAPCLNRGARAHGRLPEARPLPDFYRGIPRTTQKLRRGEPLHLIVMGSSIDRGSSPPPFAARPVVFSTGGLLFSPDDLKPGALRFGGTGPGQFEAIGEDH